MQVCCRPTPKLSEKLYPLRFLVVPCQYFPSRLPSFQPISPSPPYYIFYFAVPHLFCCYIYPCCPAYPPPFSSAALFTTDLVCHTHYSRATICPQVGSRSLSIIAQSVVVLPTHFAISVVPHLICCRPTSPPPPYPFIFSRISATMLIRRCLHC